MIIDKKPSVNSVIGIVMANGEELLARYIEETTTTLTIQQPRKMMLVPDPSNPHQAGITFVPWTLSLGDDKKIPLNKAHIITFDEAKKEASNHYQSITSPIKPVSSLAGLDLNLDRMRGNNK